jgi:polysaccharide export outer membrane protein
MQIGVAMRVSTLFTMTVLCLGSTQLLHAQRPASPPSAVAKGGYGDSEFKLGPDDVIEVSVYQEKDLSATVPVRPDGKISLPLVGEMPASGKTAVELQKEIAQKLKQYIADPAVTVVVKEVNSPKVSVMGEVKTPGVYKIKDRATLLDALALAGGLTDFAKKDKITVLRPEPNGDLRYIKVNIGDQIKGKRPDPFYVLPYDKIYVE